MAGEPIPDEVREFVLRNIDSVAQIEALVLLYSQRDESWNVGRVAKRLYTAERDIAEVLARLAADGFLSVNDGSYRFECRSPEQLTIAERAVDTYRRQLIAVTNLIHAKPRRIRQFADAFRLKKDT